ncbi:hypothetical protein ADUPG1_012009 [Aduncisulcus paluster]|uniref:Uncharacterized protein n=1 Tax=Aduncisulcus paluster TaxID=2918883 RepID=A0ABQ5K1R3_9EUKA|nr:hypothetical protein ADUPG1_012009 [Aduncisulcus paluster]
MPEDGWAIKDLGTSLSSLFKFKPWENEDEPDFTIQQVAKIDESKAYGDINPKYRDGKRELKKFLKMERHFYFKSELILPFVKPEQISAFAVSHHNWPWGIKYFNATFMVKSESGRTEAITKEYEMEKPHGEPHYFWYGFDVDLENVVSCKIKILSTWDGDLTQNHFNGIFFARDSKKMSADDSHGSVADDAGECRCMIL